MTPVELLKEARILIATRETWCQGRPHMQYRLDSGGVVDAYCALGALMQVADGREMEEHEALVALTLAAERFYDSLAEHGIYRTGGVVGLNDVYGHEAVLAMYDDAIEHAS